MSGHEKRGRLVPDLPIRYGRGKPQFLRRRQHLAQHIVVVGAGLLAITDEPPDEIVNVRKARRFRLLLGSGSQSGKGSFTHLFLHGRAEHMHRVARPSHLFREIDAEDNLGDDLHGEFVHLSG